MIEGNTTLSRVAVTESIGIMVFASKNSEIMMKVKMQATRSLYIDNNHTEVAQNGKLMNHYESLEI